MTASRKSFIAHTAALGAAVALPSKAEAQAAKPSPSPSATPTPSPASLEAALRMRRFDSSLTDEQVREIARGIDEQNASGVGIRKRRPLHNGDEPVPEFEVSR